MIFQVVVDCLTSTDLASDLNPRASRGKHLPKSTLDHAVRLTKRALRIVQYVVSSDEEGASEPVFAEAVPIGNAATEVPTERVTVAVVAPHPEDASDLIASTSSLPRLASYLETVGE